MSYFVYWDYGSCNDGSHSGGLQEFSDYDKAVARFVEVSQLALAEDGVCCFIEGEITAHREGEGMTTKCDECGIWFDSGDPCSVPMFCEKCEDHREFIPEADVVPVDWVPEQDEAS